MFLFGFLFFMLAQAPLQNVVFAA